MKKPITFIQKEKTGF